MGNKRQQQQARRGEATPRDLARAVANGTLKRAAPAEPTTATTPAPPSGRPDRVEYTRAALRDYQDYFRVFAEFVAMGRKEGFASLLKSLQGKSKGVYFLPLGWIPGDSVVLCFQEEEKVRLLTASRGAKMNLPRPSPDFIAIEDLPKPVLNALAEWQTIVETLERDVSPWNLGLAQSLLKGNPPLEHLTVAFPRFRFQKTDPEVPLGISLVPDWGGMMVAAVYNPRSFPGMPAAGQIITLEEIQRGGEAPIHKLIRTWARMEGYARDALRASRQNSR